MENINVNTESVEQTPQIITMHERDMKKITRKQLIMKIIKTTLVYLFLGFIALIVLFPFYWMIISSLKTLAEYRQAIPTFWPRQLMFSNYAEAFTTAHLGDLFMNTLYVGLVSTVLSLVITEYKVPILTVENFSSIICFISSFPTSRANTTRSIPSSCK